MRILCALAAPEQVTGKGHDFSADFWTLGIVTYEVLIGHTPFCKGGESEVQIYKNITDYAGDMNGLYNDEEKQRIGAEIRTFIANGEI